MGCSSGRPAYEISQLESDLFRELRLTKVEVDTILNSFNEIDLDGSGMIRMDELFGTCRIEETNCNKKIFGIFDSDGTTTPTSLESIEAKDPAMRLGTYPSARTLSITLARVASATKPSLRMMRDTVDSLTPAWAATSWTVILLFLSCSRCLVFNTGVPFVPRHPMAAAPESRDATALARLYMGFAEPGQRCCIAPSFRLG